LVDTNYHTGLLDSRRLRLSLELWGSYWTSYFLVTRAATITAFEENVLILIPSLPLFDRQWFHPGGDYSEEG